MIEPRHVQDRIAAVQALLSERLGLRGPTLERQVRRAGRLLPRRQRRAAQTLLGAQDWVRHPRLARLLDRRAVDAALADMHRYLARIDPHERRKTAFLRLAGGVVFNLLLFGGLLYLAWTQLLSP